MSRRIAWTPGEWREVVIAAFKICEAEGRLPLQKVRIGGLIKEAQKTLPPQRWRTFPSLQDRDRDRIVDGVNEIAAMHNERMQRHEPVAAAPQLDNEEALGIIRERGAAEMPQHPMGVTPTTQPDMTLPPTKAAPAPEPAPAAPATPQLPFTFEAIGRQLDTYLTTLAIGAVDQILPTMLRAVVPGIVQAEVALQMPKPQDPVSVPGSVDSTLLEDMVSVLDEVKAIRMFVEGRLGKMGAPQPQSQQQASTEKTTDITVGPVVDNRPLIVVTGAHTHQVVDLKRNYDKRLKGMVVKLKEKVGKDRVTVVPGGLGAIKRHLDKHVAETRLAADSLARYLGQ